MKSYIFGFITAAILTTSCVHQVDAVRRSGGGMPSTRPTMLKSPVPPVKKSVQTKRASKLRGVRVCWLPQRDTRRETRGYHRISTILVLNTGQRLHGTWRRIDERTVTIVLYGVTARERYDLAISRRGKGYYVMPLISRRNISKTQQVMILRYVRDRQRHAVVAVRKEG